MICPAMLQYIVCRVREPRVLVLEERGWLRDIASRNDGEKSIRVRAHHKMDPNLNPDFNPNPNPDSNPNPKWFSAQFRLVSLK